MSQRPALIALSLLLLLLPHAVSAQDDATETRGSQTPAPASEKKAVDLLRTISEQIGSLHSLANRVRSESAIAGLLWTRDEKRSRALFKSAADDLAEMITNMDYSDPEIYQQISSINQLRQELVNRMAQYDPEAALSLLRATRMQTADGRTKWIGDTETSMELQLAGLIARQNPARTMELARAALPKGVSYALISLLTNLQQRDPKLAQSLYKEMVAQVKDEDLDHNYELAEAAWNLLNFQPPQANEDTYRELIGTLINAVLSITPDNQSGINIAQNVYNQLQSAIPLIEKYAPARATALRQWSQNAERTFDPGIRMYQELNRAQNGTVDDILALAPRYSGELQSQIYQQAAWKAFSSGDVVRARQILNDFISDPIQRRQMLANFDSQSMETAISETRIDDVRRLAGRLKNIEQRIQIMSRLAANLAAKGDKTGALSLLNEAKTAADSAPQGPGQMSAQLQLARSFAALDPDQTFGIVQPFIGRVNELTAAAAVIDGFDTRYLSEGEWVATRYSNLGNVVNNLNLTLALLARLDFDRARSLADQIQRPELRLAAQLEIARGALMEKTVNLPMEGRRVMTIN
jgi:hypothetical protein